MSRKISSPTFHPSLWLIWILASALFGPALALGKVEAVRAGAELVVWNVGQGQWTTWINEDACLHFDMGGEFAPIARIQAACKDRHNYAVFSHWDWDHIGLIRRAARSLTGFCILKEPAGPAKPKARFLLRGISHCEKQPAQINDPLLHDLYEVSALLPLQARSRRDSRSNTESRVFEMASQVLIPGDSPSSQERRWAPKLKAREYIRWLVLGHHGSRTSTSKALLSRLIGLKQAIASARKRRYGHPHALVLKRLKQRGVAVLRTEEWGSIHFEIPDQVVRVLIGAKKDQTQTDRKKRKPEHVRINVGSGFEERRPEWKSAER